MAQDFMIRRAYDAVTPDDGFRVYVDRLWPRGLSHEKFIYDLWDKDIAPSAELREWFHADPANRWNDFAARYAAELARNPALQALKLAIAGKRKVTLLYSSHDPVHNNAVVLEKVLNP